MIARFDRSLPREAAAREPGLLTALRAFELACRLYQAIGPGPRNAQVLRRTAQIAVMLMQSLSQRIELLLPA